MSTLRRISIPAVTAFVLGTLGASAGELPQYGVAGLPISPLQISILGSSAEWNASFSAPARGD
jgi:hypothetical protein